MVNVQQQTLCMARLQCSFVEAIPGSNMCVCVRLEATPGSNVCVRLEATPGSNMCVCVWRLHQEVTCVCACGGYTRK